MAESLTLGNRFWQVEFDPDSTTLTLTDRVSGAVWQSRHPFHFNYGDFYDYDLAAHCRTRTEVEKQRLTIRFDHFDWWARYPGSGYR